MTPTRIVWHHSASRNTLPQFTPINAYHKKLGFPRSSLGFYVGYHFLIETDGTLMRAREDNEIGAHDQGENSNSIGICFAGDFSKDMPTHAQAVAGAALVKYLHDRYQIPVTRIEPHRWDDDTECPGTNLPDNWLTKQYLTHEATPLQRIFLHIGERLHLL